MVRVMFVLVYLFCSVVALADESVKITSDRTFEVQKEQLQTTVFVVDVKTQRKKRIFSQEMRDVVQWIHSPKEESRILFVTRPMVAGPEKSRFWLYDNEQTTLLGETVCDDHTVDAVSFAKIVYRCFSPHPNDPLQSLAQERTFVVDASKRSPQ